MFPARLLISDPIFLDLVQQGTSEKVSLVINFLAAFVTGFVLAYIRSWCPALAMSSMLPCITIAGGVMNKFISKYMQLSLQYIAEGGTLVEEVISTIRTALAIDPKNTSALQLQKKVLELEAHLRNFEGAKERKDWAMARLALDKCVQSMEAEGGDIPVQWRLSRIELELARGNWDAAGIAARCAALVIYY